MKILMVNSFLDPVKGGGTLERTVQLSRFFVQNAGVQCSILTIDFGLTQEQLDTLSGIEVIALPCVINRFYIPKFSFRQIKEIVNKADIIHLMGHWSAINAIVYVAARILRKPYVVCPAGMLPIFGRSKIIKYIFT